LQDWAEFAAPLVSAAVSADEDEDFVDFAGAGEAVLVFGLALEDILLLAS